MNVHDEHYENEQMDLAGGPDASRRALSRQGFLRWGLAAAVPALAVAACGRVVASNLTRPPDGSAAPGRQTVKTPEAGQTDAVTATSPDGQLALTPANLDDDDDEDLSLTPEQTEGPYFKRNSPERASLVDASTPGTRLTLTGRVLNQNGKPIARALLDFWQADASGNYDNAGYLLRGHQFTDDAGQYRLETVVPGLYPGRTRHIHVKVQAPNGPILTTQLYFPNEPRNASDGIFNPKLVLPMQATAQGQAASFDFVVQG